MPLKFSSQSTIDTNLNFNYPACIEDLCIHKKKLAQICDFFTFNYKQTPILLLTGPTGCAKSTAIKIIAKEFGFTFTEWDNSNIPNDDDLDTRKMGIFKQFESFILSGFRATCRKKHFLLIEEYPIILDNVPMRTKFGTLQSQLLELMDGAIAKPIPIVFLWSDSCDSFGANGDIFCKKFKTSPYVLHVTVNEVAPTFLRKALKSHISARYSNANGQVKRLSKCIDKVIQGNHFFCLSYFHSIYARLVSGGDVRYGTNLISLLANFPAHMAQDVCGLEMFSRDNRIETFHALGKIILKRKDFCLFDYATNFQSISMLNLYLEQNVYDFYSEIEPLSEYLELLSIGEAFTHYEGEASPSTAKYLSAFYLQKCCKYPIRFSQQMFKKPDFYAISTSQRRTRLGADSQHLCNGSPEKILNYT